MKWTLGLGVLRSGPCPSFGNIPSVLLYIYRKQHQVTALPTVWTLSAGSHPRQIPKSREMHMQHKPGWQATMMNWWAILGRDPSSAAGAVPRRGGWPDKFTRRSGGPVEKGGVGGTGKAAYVRWASANSLKCLIQDGRWTRTRAGAAFPRLGRPLQRNQTAGH